jgi:hypothetical protein
MLTVLLTVLLTVTLPLLDCAPVTMEFEMWLLSEVDTEVGANDDMTLFNTAKNPFKPEHCDLDN